MNIIYVVLHFCLSPVSFPDSQNSFERQLACGNSNLVWDWDICCPKMIAVLLSAHTLLQSFTGSQKFYPKYSKVCKLIFQRYRRNGKNNNQFQKNLQTTPRKSNVLKYLLKGIKELLHLETGIFTCMYKPY